MNDDEPKALTSEAPPSEQQPIVPAQSPMISPPPGAATQPSPSPPSPISRPPAVRKPKRPWRSTEEEFGAERAAMRADLDQMLEDARTPFYDDRPPGRAQSEELIARLLKDKPGRTK